MNKRIYTIFMKDGSNDFVVGRIFGIVGALTGEKISFSNCNIEGREPTIWMKVNTTGLRYNRIKKEIEADYPGLCAFE